MTTSGTAAFTLDLTDIVEEAFERCGLEVRSGYDLRTARRSLNLLLMEWANRGVNMWTLEQGSVALVSGQATYELPEDTIDILEHVVRKDDADIIVSRISWPVYAAIPTKTTLGRPIQLAVMRGVAQPVVTLWPVPDSDAYSLVYWRLRRMQDMTTGAVTADVPFRFIPALIAGLAFQLAVKLPGVDPNRAIYLKTEYESQFLLASLEDRERATTRITPRIGR